MSTDDPRHAAATTAENPTGRAPAEPSGPPPVTPAAGNGAPAARRRGLDGRVIGGRYEVTATVAAGANTLIADATDRELGRAVTLKLVRPELSESASFRRRFGEQMDAVAALAHPHLAAVYDWGEERIGQRTTVYVVSEYLAGGSLRDMFDRRRYLTPSQALMIGLEACRGLDFAHDQGLVHTELTPSKLVFGDDRRLRIVDFGLARILGEPAWSDPSRLPTHVARYASPEQALSEPVDGKTDVYSLALILVEAVTGAVPFKADSTVATLSARIGKLMPVSADLGPLAAVLERAGRPEAAERASAAQFGRALVRAAERMPRPAPIPILTKDLFRDDPSAIRRPNDPTGGIARPPAEPEPALVSPGPASPDDATAEIAGPAAGGEPAAAGAAASEPAPAGVGPAGSALAGVALAGAALVGPASVADEPVPGATPDEPAGADGAVPGADADRTSSDDAMTAEVEEVPADRPAADEVPADRPAADEVSADRPPADEVPADRPAADEAAPDAVKSSAADHADLATLVERTPPHAPPAEAEPVPAGRVGRRERRRRRKAAAGAAAAAAPPEPAVARAPRRHRVLSFLFGLLLVGALVALGFAAWRLFRTPTHEIPDLAGMTEQEAVAAVEEFKWDVATDATRDDVYDTPGEVVRTSPAAGRDLAEGSPLVLYVSEGPEYRVLPNLAGLTVDEATAELAELKLVVGTTTEQYDEVIAAGTVMSNSADGAPVGENVLPDTPVNLVVSQGPQPRTVPDLRGKTEDEAARLLEQFGLQLTIVEPVFDNEVEAGLIATQTPAAADELERGGTVSAAVSKGPDLVAMPDLTGLTLPQIRQALADAGLGVGGLLGSTQGTFYAASVGGDQVQAGDPVLRGSSVDLIVL